MKELEEAAGLSATLLIGLKGYLSDQLGCTEEGQEEQKSVLYEKRMKELRLKKLRDELSKSVERAQALSDNCLFWKEKCE